MAEARHSFACFRQRVLDDPDLQQHLREVADARLFPARVAELGAELGYRFTIEVVEDALDEARRLWIERWL